MLTQCVGASPAHVITAISIFHQMRSPETPRNGAHNHTGVATGACYRERTLAREIISPMYPDWQWACTVGVQSL